MEKMIWLMKNERLTTMDGVNALVNGNKDDEVKRFEEFEVDSRVEVILFCQVFLA